LFLAEGPANGAVTFVRADGAVFAFVRFSGFVALFADFGVTAAGESA
jgi:hypothetical protein